MRATIIIFGAAVRPDGQPSTAMHDRVGAALAHAATLDQPHFMPTGGIGRYGRAEAEVMADLLAARGVPRERIIPEPTAINTIGSVLACARLLRDRPGPVFAASSAYHLPRCLLLLGLAGLRPRPCPPPRPMASSTFLKRWRWRLRELPAIPVDLALMVWHRLQRHARTPK